MLQHLPGRVFPYLSSPLVVADFYLRAFDWGSPEVSVLSLSGLFYLITRHNLGDPEVIGTGVPGESATPHARYFVRLYQLLTPETLALKYRARFQRLLLTSFQSTLLPASMATAFAKKCMRCAALCSHPGTVMWLLAAAYNLIQRHHSVCAALLNREKVETLQNDPFDPWAPLLPDGMEQAANSSLWELRLLKKHHVPMVARLAGTFDVPFFKKTSQRIDCDDFLDLTATSLVERELKTQGRKCRRTPPPVAFEQVFDEEREAVLYLAGLLGAEADEV